MGTTALVPQAVGGFIEQAQGDLLATWLAGKHPSTVRAYRTDLEAFGRWAGADSMSEAVAAFLGLAPGEANSVAARYRGAMIDAKLAPSTINGRLGALRSVVKLARLVGRIGWSLEVPSVENVGYRDTRGPGVDACRKMLRTLEARTDAKSRRDLALVCLMADMGLRRQECVTLDLEHYDRDNAKLSVHGKKRSMRELVTIPAPTMIALDAWIAARGSEAGPLFVNFDRANKGNRLTGRSVARTVAAAGESAGVVGAVRPHGLRHTAITNALDAFEGNVREVQKFSRHRDIRTLQIYDDARTDIAGKVAAAVAASLR